MTGIDGKFAVLRPLAFARIRLQPHFAGGVLGANGIGAHRDKSGHSGSDPIADTSPLRHAWWMSELSTVECIKVWAGNLKRDVIALWLAARDPRVPWYAKALSAAVAAYALSPIDLIPDFIPILGYLDDLLIVPLGIWAAIKLIPEPIMAELRAQAFEQRKPTSKAGLFAVILIWFAAIAITVWLFGLMERR